MRAARFDPLAPEGAHQARGSGCRIRDTGSATGLRPSVAMHDWTFDSRQQCGTTKRGETRGGDRDAAAAEKRCAERVRAPARQGSGGLEIADRLGVGKITVWSYARRLGIPPQTSVRHALRLGGDPARPTSKGCPDAVPDGSGSRRCLDKAVARCVITPSGRFRSRTPGRGRRSLTGPISSTALAQEGSRRTVASRCGISEWMGKPLSMQLHHKNGDGSDNRLRTSVLCAATATPKTNDTAAGTGIGSPIGTDA